MDVRFTISKKIAVGFSLLILAVAAVFFLTNNTLKEARKISLKINEIYSPSLRAIEDLDKLTERSLLLIDQWLSVQSRNDELNKIELKILLANDLPTQLRLVNAHSIHWTQEEKDAKERVFSNLDRMILVYQDVMHLLPDFESYNDPIVQMSAKYEFLEGETIPTSHERVKKDLTFLATTQETNVNQATLKMNTLFDRLTTNFLIFVVGVLLAGGLIALFVIRSITKPVNVLKKTLLYLGKGVYPKNGVAVSNDEIGDMAFAVNRLVDGLRKTREFSLNVGSGNFEARYEPLSEEDELGHALLKMRDDLAENERGLELKVEQRTNEVVQQKEEIERQKERVTQLYKDLTDSINYAKRLQQTILPTQERVHSLFPDSFVFYKPKDIVSGDFYWFKSQGSKKMFAAVDCTGHGVPGAFMSLVGYNVLNQVTKVFTRPSQILNNLNRLASELLSGGSDNVDIRDGMDISLCTFDRDKMELEFAGAYNPLYIVRNKELTLAPGDRFSIGSFDYGEKQFTNHVYQLEEGDCLYVFSDGYADQFGGPKGKKFLKKKFREMILDISDLRMNEQLSRIKSSWVQWKGKEDQVDDILVIGIRV